MDQEIVLGNNLKRTSSAAIHQNHAVEFIEIVESDTKY